MAAPLIAWLAVGGRSLRRRPIGSASLIGKRAWTCSSYSPRRIPIQPNPLMRRAPGASYAPPTLYPATRCTQQRGIGVYRAFARTNFILLWANSPEFRRFIYLLTAATLAFVGYSMERAPVTGRWRFNCVPQFLLQRRAEALYQELLEEFRDASMPDPAPEVQRLKKVVQRLLASSHRIYSTPSDLPWTLQVVHDEEANAFVLPGCHIFVHSGILPLFRDETGGYVDDRIAALLGHEIAHQVARHAAEGLSYHIATLIGAWLSTNIFNVSSLSTLDTLDGVYKRPNSRTTESEADYIGLMMMAAAGYEPRAAIEFWTLMDTGNATRSEYLGTHPSGSRRIQQIQAWMGEASEKHAASIGMREGSGP